MINWKKKCIFARIPKTGSSSIMYGIHGDHSKRFRKWAATIRGKQGWININWIQNKYQFDLNHIPLPYIKGAVSPERYENFFKFSFVRNPWLRVHSQYRFVKYSGESWSKNCADLNFSEFVHRLDDPSTLWYSKTRWTQAFYCQGADFVGRFENLQEDYEKMLSMHDRFKNAKKRLKHVNRHFGPRTHWMNDYTEELMRIVEKKYEEDIDIFKYRRPE